MIEAVFVIPVGPKDGVRVAWTVESIRRNCTNYRIHLLMDDIKPEALNPRLSGDDLRFSIQDPPTKGHGGKIWVNLCRAFSHAVAEPDISPGAIFIKIDCDAILIRSGFIERAQMLFATRPKTGQLGQCYTNILGGRFHNRGWRNYFDKLMGWRGFLRFTLASLKAGEGIGAGFTAHRKYCDVLNAALKNGYPLGDFALGGCYIMRREVIEGFRIHEFAKESPFRFLPPFVEDVFMTPHVYATGYAALDDVADGGLFAIDGKEFRMDPFTLKARGHYVIHPTKYGYKSAEHNLSESELVAALTAPTSMHQRSA